MRRPLEGFAELSSIGFARNHYQSRISWSLKQLGLIIQNINSIGDTTWARFGLRTFSNALGSQPTSNFFCAPRVHRAPLVNGGVETKRKAANICRNSPLWAKFRTHGIVELALSCQQ